VMRLTSLRRRRRASNISGGLTETLSGNLIPAA
jgi:hypothetical protein